MARIYQAQRCLSPRAALRALLWHLGGFFVWPQGSRGKARTKEYNSRSGDRNVDFDAFSGEGDLTTIW